MGENLVERVAVVGKPEEALADANQCVDLARMHHPAALDAAQAQCPRYVDRTQCLVIGCRCCAATSTAEKHE